MDRLDSFAIFVKSVDCGSFSAAAEALNLSPQVIGRHVQRLEERMGVQVTGHRLTPRLRSFIQSAARDLAKKTAALAGQPEEWGWRADPVIIR